MTEEERVLAQQRVRETEQDYGWLCPFA